MTRTAYQRRRRCIRPVVAAGLLLMAAAIGMATARSLLSERMQTKVMTMMPSRFQRAVAAGMAWLASTGAAPAQPLPPPRPTTFGINLPAMAYWASTVPFANLMIGSDWLTDHWTPLPDQYHDKDGNILSLPAGGDARRFLSLPPTGPAGIEVRCTYTGSGMLRLEGGGQTLAVAPGGIRFRVVRPHDTTQPPYLVLKGVESGRPFRDLDCRETTLAAAARFRPAFLASLHGYGVVRFMDWQNANHNQAVTWATRHGPAGNLIDRDGVAIEDMLALVRETDADPWFVMPWNADDDYIVRFAQLVRAQLPAGRHVYVEVGNEVWNQGFPVGQQALKEGLARNLGTNDLEAAMRRYAQRTSEVMRLWETAFAGRSGLVRVLATMQVLPLTARIALSFGDTAAHVDALSTSAYFGETYGGTANTRENVLARLSAAIPATLALMKENRQVATSFGKRYVAYEGGEALALPDQPPLAEALQHDPAQYALVQRFLAGWRREVGDTLSLYVSVARVAPAGAWGLAEWEDEPLSEAPKLRAVRDAMALH